MFGKKPVKRTGKEIGKLCNDIQESTSSIDNWFASTETDEETPDETQGGSAVPGTEDEENPPIINPDL